MKHSFLKFPHKSVSYLPKMQTRRFPGLARSGSSSYKSDGGKDDDDASEEQKQLLTKIRGLLKTEFETRGMQDGKKVEDLITAYFKDLPLETIRGYKAAIEESQENVRTMAERLEKLEKRGGSPDYATRKNVREQLKDYLEKNKDAWDRFRNGESKAFGQREGNADITLQVRAAATMTIATGSNSSAFVPNVEVEPGLTDLARNRPFIEQYANASNTSSSRIVWAEKTNPQGEAAFLGEGGVKPLISFEYVTRQSFAKKVADKIKISTEMFEDVDFIAAEIESELAYQVDIKTDEDLLTGAGDGTESNTNLKGLVSFVGGFVLTSIHTTTPNYFDVIRASIAQIVSLNHVPTHLFISPIDGANMDLTKDENGRPLAMEYKTQDGKLFRVQPIETNQIEVGSFLLGDMTKFFIRNYKPFAVSYGYVNDDFEKNLFTVIGERRLHSYVKTNHIGAFVYDQFADVQTAITAA
jgi:hypothetical protein